MRIIVFSYLKKFLNLFLVVSGLNCGLWDVLWLCKGSVVAMCGLSCPGSTWDLSSLNRDPTHVPCSGTGMS